MKPPSILAGMSKVFLPRGSSVLIWVQNSSLSQSDAWFGATMPHARTQYGCEAGVLEHAVDHDSTVGSRRQGADRRQHHGSEKRQCDRHVPSFRRSLGQHRARHQTPPRIRTARPSPVLPAPGGNGLAGQITPGRECRNHAARSARAAAADAAFAYRSCPRPLERAAPRHARLSSLCGLRGSSWVDAVPTLEQQPRRLSRIGHAQRSYLPISSAVASTWPAIARSSSPRPARKPTRTSASSACSRKK